MDTPSPGLGPEEATPCYDFRRCKNCNALSAAPLYRLDRSSIYACSRCDLHFVDRLDEEASGREPAPLNGQSRAFMEARMRDGDHLLEPRVELVRRYLPLEGARLLDVGAGTGQFLHRIADEGVQAHGLEPSSLRRAFAQEKYGLSLRPETAEAFCRSGDYSGYFGAATLWDVIEHVNFPVPTLQGVLGCLKPGGWLFVDTPSRDAPAYRLSERVYRLSGGNAALYLESFYAPVPYGHKQIFRPRQLVELAERVGFEVNRLDSGYLPRVPGLLSLLRPKKRIVLVCRRPLG